MAFPQFKVVITDYDYGDIAIERGILEHIGARVIGLQAKHEDDLLTVARDCDAMITQYARVGSLTIAAMEQCKVIARYGVGVDIVDVEAATQKNILVTNVRDYCTEEVADHAVAMWLTLVRKLSDYDRATHGGIWHWKSGRPIYRLRGRIFGIVSFGKIGRAIADRARSFGVDLIVYDPYVDEASIERASVRRVSKDELLRQSDFIVMQVPMTSTTKYFLGPAEFAMMKHGVIIINTGRGPTIDNTALDEALKTGRVAAAGLDDLEEEPAKRATWRPSDNTLLSHPNVIVTPHAAYYSEESIALARETAAREVACVLRGERPTNPVNNVRLASGEMSLPAA
jgi:D-3-phosphoglycerate dehydrogenase / 2-oxoglutarate reductase